MEQQQPPVVILGDDEQNNAQDQVGPAAQPDEDSEQAHEIEPTNGSDEPTWVELQALRLFGMMPGGDEAAEAGGAAGALAPAQDEHKEQHAASLSSSRSGTADGSDDGGSDAGGAVSSVEDAQGHGDAAELEDAWRAAGAAGAAE